MSKTRCVVSLFSIVMMIPGVGSVFAQGYPTKPIRIVSGAAGGSSDYPARLIAQGIAGPLGQPVIIDNRGGNIAKEEVVAKALPDGYTWLIGGSSLYINSYLVKLPYDPVKDFIPATLISRQVYVVAVHASVPANSIKELIALAKAKPGALNYATGGIGGGSHLNTELFKSMAGINMVGVPYKGNPPSIAALSSGEVQVGIFEARFIAPQVKSGKLKALAVTSAEPSTLAPGLPTMAASGVPGFDSVGFTGFFAPAKTPTAIISRINQEIVRYLNQPGVKEQFLSGGEEVVAGSPEQFAAVLKEDTAKKVKVLKDAGIKVGY